MIEGTTVLEPAIEGVFLVALNFVMDHAHH